MMSVFCSKTLIFAPECWKCIVRGADFKFFPRGQALDPPRNLCLWCEFFPSLPTPKLLPPLKTLLKTLKQNHYSVATCPLRELPFYSDLKVMFNNFSF